MDLHIAQMVSPDLESKGQIRFDIDSRRYGSNSNINGQIRLENASFRTVDSPLGLDDANGVFTVTKERMEVTSFQARWEEVRSPRKVESTTGLPCSLIWRWRPARFAFAIQKGCGRLWIRTSPLPEMPKLQPWVGSVKIQHISFTPDFDINTFADQFGGAGTSAPSQGFAQTVKMDVGIQSTSQMDLSSSQVSIRGNANLAGSWHGGRAGDFGAYHVDRRRSICGR